MPESKASFIKRSHADAARRRQRLAFYSTALSGAVPFLPPLVPAVAGGLAGLYAATQSSVENEYKAATPIDPRYGFVPLEDGQVVQHLYLGEAVPWSRWKELLNELGQKHGEVTAAMKQKLLVSLIESRQTEPMYWTDDQQTRHLFVGGSTGLGKTSLNLSLAYQQIARGGGLGLFDAKGDEEIAASILTIAKLCGREHDVQYFNLERPELSHTYNPLMFGNTRQLISSSMKLYGKGGDPFFFRKTRNAVTACLVCLLAQPGSPPFNFKDMAALLGSLTMFVNLWKRIPLSKKDEREFVSLFLREWIEMNHKGEVVLHSERYNEIMSGVKSMVLDFCHTEYGQLLNDYNPDIELREAMLTNKIIIISVQALSDQQTTEIFGKLLKADIARAIGQMNDARERCLIPFHWLFDEYGMFADGESGSDETLFAQARKTRVALMPSVQGRGFLDKISTYFTDNILTNCWNHLWFDVRDVNSRKTAIDLAGTTISRFASDGESDSFGQSFHNYDPGSLRNESHGKSQTRSSSERREQLLNPEDFDMDAGECLMVGKFGVYKVALPLLRLPEPLPPLSTFSIPRYDKPRRSGLDLMAKAAREFESLMRQIDQQG